IIAYRALPVSDLPQVDYPTISVNASLPGANADTMASSVATVLERQFTTIAGVDSMISNSRQGSTNITLQFNLDRDIDGASVQVDPNALATRGIGLNEIQSAIQKWNVNIPTGTLFGRRTSYNIIANGQLPRAANFRPMVVSYRHGAPVRLDEVANVIDSVEDNRQMALMYGDQFGKNGAAIVMLAV